jgi:hypothetical protein
MSIRSLGAGIVIGASIATAVGIAYAAIPDPSGVIHACYQNVTSANKPVKLLDTGKTSTCPSGWKAVSWNQKGIQGPPGQNGTNGQPGPPGPAGTNVVYRARGGATGPSTGPGVLFAGDTWTQAANEIDSLALGPVTFTVPLTCSGTAPKSGTQVGAVLIGVDGTQYWEGVLVVPGGASPGQTVTVDPNYVWVGPGPTPNVNAQYPYILWEPGSAAAHNFQSSEVGSSCDPESVTVNNVTVDVIGVS